MPSTSRAFICAATVVLLLRGGYAGAEDRLQVFSATEVNAPLRVEIDDLTILTGCYRGLRGDSLILETDGRATMWSIASVTSVWERKVTRRRGLLIGATTGAVALGVLAYSVAKHPIGLGSAEPRSEPSTGDLYAATTIGALAGFFIGAGVGSLIIPKSENWVQTFPKPRSPW